MEDNELLAEFVVEANEHLADIENQFLAIEEAAPNLDGDLVNEAFRAIHSVKGAAGFMGLTTVNDLTHHLENILNLMRNEELAPTSAIVDDMLKGADALRGLIEDVENSNGADIGEHLSALERIAATAMAAGDEPPAEAKTEEAIESRPVTAAPTAELHYVPTDEKPLAAFNAKLAETSAAKAKKEESTKPAPAEAPIRVAVGVLDSLMNLAGELVLSRNQLLQAVSTEERTGLETISARIDQVTSELQEAIVQTRMQPIGTVFGRFPRVVRDLSSKLGKPCDLLVDGEEVEIDKTIIEAIGDPLTHLVRNACDHGVEDPATRVAAGKPAKGTIHLKACYQAGKVRIEIQDDGGGIDPEKLKGKAVSKGILSPEQAAEMSDRDAIRLIFAPGFSTAAEVTDVSGRGVGMDVVRTNITKLGGTVDIESELGKGTNIVVTLPLTLAIIPSLIVQVGRERFAIPQVNIAELVRVRESERGTKLGRVQNAEVLRLRGQLLPLVRLQETLGCQEAEGPIQGNATDATNIVVVDTGQTRFGLVVEALHDSEEIVVKPLGRHHKACRQLAGATILGDGRVALILDIAGLAAEAELGTDGGPEADTDKPRRVNGSLDVQSMLLFKNNEADRFAVPRDLITRIERIKPDQIDSVAGQEVLQYRRSTLPLIRLESCVTAGPAECSDSIYVIVYEVRGREVGLIAPVLEDIREIENSVDTFTFGEPGIIGSLVINEQTVRMIDLFELVQISHPGWFVDDAAVEGDSGGPPLILVAEDSGFFRSQVTKVLEEKGYRVLGFEEGQLAWEHLDSQTDRFDLIVTDIEMPNMSGFELCDRVKQDPRFAGLPVIALTSLAGSADMQRGIEVGIDDYQIKMDRDKLLTAVQNFTGKGVSAVTGGSHA